MRKHLPEKMGKVYSFFFFGEYNFSIIKKLNTCYNIAAARDLVLIYLFDYAKFIYKIKQITFPEKKKLWRFPVSKRNDIYSYDRPY